MPDRWTHVCRRLTPARWRAAAFDPAVADLALTHLARVRLARGAIRRALVQIRWRAAIFASALACWRLDTIAIPAEPAVLAHRPHDTTRRGDSMLATIATDLRHAIRRFAKEPLFALVAVGTLALGIGANVATFGFMNTYLLATLSVPQATSVVRVFEGSKNRPLGAATFPNYADARDGATGLDLAAYVATGVAVGPDNASEARKLELVTGNYFSVMRLAPVAGRLIDTRDDGVELAHPVVVVSEDLWRARYGADPSVVGSTLLLNGAPYDVVGIVPRAFHGADADSPVEMWAPITMQQWLRPRGPKNVLSNRGWGWLNMIGRRGAGVGHAAAQSSLDRVAGDLNTRFPSTDDPLTFTAMPAMSLSERSRRALAPYLTMTLAFTALLLIVTCANLAGVMQARVLSRRRELAIRQSLGAGRGRLVSEWLSECFVIAAGGGVAGFGVARLTVLAIARFRSTARLFGDAPINTPVDWRVLGFAAALSIAAALLFGLWPAMRAAAAQPVSLLREEGGTSTGGRRGTRMRRGAVVVQMTASAMLLLVAGLFASTLRNLRQFDLGFTADHLAIVSADLKFRRIPAAEYGPYTDALLARTAAIPGVSSTAIAVDVPLGGGEDAYGYRIPGYTPPNGDTSVSLDSNVVSASYFETMGIGFVRGRGWEYGAGFTPSLVINETMARRFWANGDAIGKPVEFIGQGTFSVSGIVKDGVYHEIGEAPMPEVYLPAESAPQSDYTLVARTTTDPAVVVPSLKQSVTAIDGRARAYDATTFEELRREPLAPRSAIAAAAWIFGGLALFLTGLGLYGVVSTSVGQRTREIGVRMALGAQKGDVLVGVLRESLMLTAIGLAGGLAGGYELAGTLRAFLFGTSAFNAVVYVGVAMLLAAVALAAAWLPARRAAAVDPVTALRA